MSDLTRERLINDSHFPALKAWLIQKTGLSYYADKDTDLATALVRSFEGAPPPALQILRQAGDGHLEVLDRIVEQLTIGETFFFRHLEMFHALRDHVIPDVLERNKSTRRFRIWSAGCSVGAEPYSLAILLRDVMDAQFHDWSIEILGTDINRRFLKIAQAGEYDRWALRGLPEELWKKCFTAHKGKWLLNDHFRHGVKFRHHNMASDPFPMPTQELYAFDLIICRNVMIYFDTPTIQRMADQFRQTLVPGGWLAVGHAEPHTEIFQEYRTFNAPGAVLYQRASFQPKKTPPALVAKPAPLPITSLPVPTPLPFHLPAQPPTEVAPQAQRADLEKLQLLANTGDLDGALKCCERLIAEDRLNAAYHFYLGVLRAQREDLAGAGQALSRCLYLDRKFTLAHYYLGVVELGLGRKSARHFRNCLLTIDTLPEDDQVPLGDELTVAELRALVAIHLPATHE